MKKKIYSSKEKKAYYTGYGVGLTGTGSTTDGLTRKAYMMMSDKEKSSYIAGYQKGLDNPDILAGIKRK